MEEWLGEVEGARGCLNSQGGGAAALASPRTRIRCHRRVCMRMRSKLGDEGEQEGELTGKRRPRERREDDDGDEQSQTTTVLSWAFSGERR